MYAWGSVFIWMLLLDDWTAALLVACGHSEYLAIVSASCSQWLARVRITRRLLFVCDLQASQCCVLTLQAPALHPQLHCVARRVEIGSFNQTDVAVKILTDLGPNQPTPALDCPSWDEARLRALRQEVGILATLRHPNVVLFMGVCLSPPAIVTEYCPLGSLYDVLKKVSLTCS